MPLTRFTDSVLSFPSVGFRNHAAADPGCHSDRLLQQMDEGRRSSHWAPYAIINVLHVFCVI